MASGSDLTPYRAPRVARRTRGAESRWSRRRGVVSVFAGLAAVGMAVGALAPLGTSLAVAQEKPVEVVSLWADSRGDAQALATDDAPADAVTLDRSGFTVYMKPTPTPTPEPSAEGERAGSSRSAPVRYSGGGSSSDWLAAAGISESDWGYVDYIVSKESGWNPNATNASSGACGLVQAYPCSKVPGSGYDPVDNLKWANGYAVGRYGSWADAHAFWTSNHWW
ncbi:MAG: transglycosylase SLT domain-containing protein [Microbacterium arborescens]